jgi:hypothetical protein
MEYIWYGAHPFDKNLFEERLSNRDEPFKNSENVRRQFTIYDKGYLKPKCISALWGSPNVVNSKNKKYYTWKDWCIKNEFRRNPNENLLKYYQNFKLKQDAKILKINSWESIIEFFEKYTEISESLFKVLKDEYNIYKLIANYNISKLILDFALTEEFSELKVDYEKIYNEFDGMEIYHFDYQLVHCIFSTWDCDSICVWHKDCIYLLDGGKA